MTDDELDAVHEKAEGFLKEFKTLVRKYADEKMTHAQLGLLKTLMQERTSVFNPYIWSDK